MEDGLRNFTPWNSFTPKPGTRHMAPYTWRHIGTGSSLSSGPMAIKQHDVPSTFPSGSLSERRTDRGGVRVIWRPHDDRES